MSGVTEDNIIGLVIVASTSRRRMTGSDSLDTSYTISVRNVELSFSTLSNQLKSNVAGGVFSETLQSANLPILANAYSDSVEIVDQTPGSNDDEGDGNYNNILPSMIPTIVPSSKPIDPTLCPTSMFQYISSFLILFYIYSCIYL